MGIRLTELWTYPLKSAAGIALSSAQLHWRGLQQDRRWMLVDRDNVFVSQRRFPVMCLLQVALVEDGIEVRRPDGAMLELPGLCEGPVRRVRVWDDEVEAIDAGDVAAQWFSRYLGETVRLVVFNEQIKRPLDSQYAKHSDHTAFADGFPFLLISQASLDALNTRLPSPVGMERFRPNLVVDGCEAFAEDQWTRIVVGGIGFRVVKPCSRCVIPSIVQETAQRDPHINKVLAEFRRRDGQVFFGQNLIADNEGLLETGMAVEISTA